MEMWGTTQWCWPVLFIQASCTLLQRSSTDNTHHQECRQESHNGVHDTLTKIRSKYWIVKGRRSARSFVPQCVICRRFEGKSFTAPLPPPLPKFRVQETKPHTHTALDFAGPLHVKTSVVTQSSKMWVCLYTCCVTCAVYIDIVPDMSTDTFLRSLRQFCARQGTPLLLVSDNTKTCKGAAKVKTSSYIRRWRSSL